MFARVSIQMQDFNLGVEVDALRKNDKRVGAVCSFIGTVRDRNDGLNVSSMELEHYPGMTEKAIEAMIDEALPYRRTIVFYFLPPLPRGETPHRTMD